LPYFKKGGELRKKKGGKKKSNLQNGYFASLGDCALNDPGKEKRKRGEGARLTDVSLNLGKERRSKREKKEKKGKGPPSPSLSAIEGS